MKFDPSENFFQALLVWYSRDSHSQMPPIMFLPPSTLPNDLVYGLVKSPPLQ